MGYEIFEKSMKEGSFVCSVNAFKKYHKNVFNFLNGGGFKKIICE
jgi:hypothetical protein